MGAGQRQGKCGQTFRVTFGNAGLEYDMCAREFKTSHSPANQNRRNGRDKGELLAIGLSYVGEQLRFHSQ